MAHITATRTERFVTKHVVSNKDGITLGWIIQPHTGQIWAERVGEMAFGDTPRYATVDEALATFN